MVSSGSKVRTRPPAAVQPVAGQGCDDLLDPFRCRGLLSHRTRVQIWARSGLDREVVHGNASQARADLAFDEGGDEQGWELAKKQPPMQAGSSAARRLGSCSSAGRSGVGLGIGIGLTDRAATAVQAGPAPIHPPRRRHPCSPTVRRLPQRRQTRSARSPRRCRGPRMPSSRTRSADTPSPR